MTCTHAHRHSIFCLVPPYILDSIINHGSEEQRKVALNTKAADNTMRAFRLHALAKPYVLTAQAASTSFKDRSIYTANSTQNLPGTLIRQEGQPATGDIACDEAYDGLGATYDFFDQIFGRNSIDGAGLPLMATVHFGVGYNNAFWNSEQMVFGDGDGDIFNRFTIAIDVIGHELSHGVTENEARLQYFNQSGALNESMSDVFGSLIKQFTLQQTAAQADWLIGKGLLANGVAGIALRSMQDPGSAFNDPLLGKDPQPKHMRDYVKTFEDNGGVHINSGIPNHAFYQVAMNMGGYAWEKAGRIWYNTLCDKRLQPDANFLTFAKLTYDIAGRDYGVASAEQKAVEDGWVKVGIKV